MLQGLNKELVPVKAHYFLFNAATGPMVSFLPTIAKQLGFSSSLVGTIYSILPISGLISKPLFCGLADKFRLHKTFLLIFQVIIAIGFLSVYFIPEIERNANVTLRCDNAEAFVEACSTTGFTKQVLADMLNSTANLKCELACDTSSKAYKELCSYWRVAQYCNLNETNVPANPKFDFTAEFNMSENLQVGKCVYVHIRDAIFSDGIVHVPICQAPLKTSCLVNCYKANNRYLNRFLQEVNKTDSPVQVSTYQFHLFLWAAIISWVGMAVVVNVADAICFDLLGDDRRKEYGKQKMWGSIAFGIFGISAGYLVDVFSQKQSEKDYTCIFYIMLIAIILDIVVSATLKKKTTDCSNNEPSVLWELWSVGRECRVLVFGWWCIGAGICTGVVWNFVFWYTEDLATDVQFTWLKTLQGLLTGIQCFMGELPFNFISGCVLRKLGHVNVTSLVLLVYAVRFMAYSMVTNPWMFLPLELLHGPSFGLCWPIMVSYGDKVTPSGTKATMQGLVGAVFEGIGVSAGSSLCGWLMDQYGGAVTFRVFSVGALLWLAIYWMLQLLLRKTKAIPIYQGHNHLASSAASGDAILMSMSQELQTY